MSRLPLALAALLLASAACKAKIGDECKRSIDCSLQGERTCDLSHRIDESGAPNPDGDGECIIDGCSATSCPSEAVCVRVYGVDFLTIPCEPELEDRLPTGQSAHACCPGPAASCDDAGVRSCVCAEQPACCEPDGWTHDCAALVRLLECATCPRDDCLPNELCLPEGLCVDAQTARTSCRKECSDDDSCRDGYICRQTSSGGVYVVPEVETPADIPVTKICVPRNV